MIVNAELFERTTSTIMPHYSTSRPTYYAAAVPTNNRQCIIVTSDVASSTIQAVGSSTTSRIEHAVENPKCHWH